MGSLPFDSAVVLTPRSDILDAFRQELKAIEIFTIFTPEGVERCLSTLAENPDALLVLDWAYGSEKVLSILEALRSPQIIDLRPSLLFSVEKNSELEGVATEYLVSLLHRGEVTRNLVNDLIKEISQTVVIEPEIKDILRQVVELRANENWETADQILLEACNEFRGNERLAIEAAESKYHLGDPQTAMDILSPFIGDDDPNIRALNLYGRCQLKLGLYQESSLTLQKAKLINPFNIERLLALGEAYLHDDQIKKGRANFETAMELAPKEGRAIGGVGKSMLLGEEINEALTFLKQLSGPKEMASVFNSAAVISMVNGRHIAGMKLYHVALQSIGSDPTILAKIGYNMGIGFHRHGDNERAKECFGLAAIIDPENQKAKTNYELMDKTQASFDIPDDPKACVQRLLDIELDQPPITPAVDDDVI